MKKWFRDETWVAATALELGVPILTLDIDFSFIKKLEVASI